MCGSKVIVLVILLRYLSFAAVLTPEALGVSERLCARKPGGMSGED